MFHTARLNRFLKATGGHDPPIGPLVSRPDFYKN
jgi:hypothetical protein